MNRLSLRVLITTLILTLSFNVIAHADPADQGAARERSKHRVHTRVETSKAGDENGSETSGNKRTFAVELHYQKNQAPPPDPTPRAMIDVGEDGFVVTSADERFALQLSPFVQFAYRLDLSDADGGNANGFTLEKFRPTIRGSYGRIIDYKFTLDVRSNAVSIHDAYVTLKAHPQFLVRLGMQKPAFGIEQQQSSRNLLFLSRSMASSIGSSRDLGLLVEARPHQRLRLELGVYNGADDRKKFKSISPRSVAMNGRARWAILGGDGATTEAPGYLTVGGAVSLRRVEGEAGSPHLTDRKSIGGRQFFDYDPTLYAHGRKFAATGFLFGGYKGLYAYAEYVTSNQQVRDGTDNGRLLEHAWSAGASYAFGGMNGWSGVVPNRSIFDGGLGALRLAFRVHGHTFRTRGGGWVTPLGGTPRDSTAAYGVSGGVGWQLSKRVRIQADYDNTQLASRFTFAPSVREHIVRFGVTAGY